MKDRAPSIASGSADSGLCLKGMLECDLKPMLAGFQEPLCGDQLCNALASSSKVWKG